MTDTQSNTLVLKDAAGTYFLVTIEALERGRVPAARTAEVERLIAGTQADDVSGHFFLSGCGLPNSTLVEGPTNQDLYPAVKAAIERGRELGLGG